jgi:hypothetical protein
MHSIKSIEAPQQDKLKFVSKYRGNSTPGSRILAKRIIMNFTFRKYPMMKLPVITFTWDKKRKLHVVPLCLGMMKEPAR